MTHWNNDWQGRERERGREDVYERINFNVSYEMWNFLLADFFKIKMKDILRFKSKVISTIKIAAEDKLPSSVYKEKYLISGIK